MAAVMYQAAKAEDNSTNRLTENIARLEYENKTLRELLAQPFPTNKPDQTDSVNANQWICVVIMKFLSMKVKWIVHCLLHSKCYSLIVYMYLNVLIHVFFLVVIIYYTI